MGFARLTGLILLAVSAGNVMAQTPAATPPPRQNIPEGAPKQYSIEDFFRRAERTNFRLSEDGKTLGFLQRSSVDGKPPRQNVFVQTLDGSKPVGEARRLTGETARDIAGYFIKGTNTVIYVKDFGGDENFHVVAVDIKSGVVKDLTPYAKTRADILDDLQEDPNHILVTHNRRDPKVFDVYKIDVRNGSARMVAKNPGNITGWQTDHAGRVRMAVVTDGLQTRLQYRPDEKSAFKTIVTTDYKTDVSPQFFTADNRKVYAVSNRGRDKSALILLDPVKPDAEEKLFEHPDVDVESAAWSRARKALTRVTYETTKTEHKFFDANAEALYKKIEAKLPGYETTLQNSTLSEDKWIVAASNDRTQGTRYIYDVASDSLSKLGDINPALPERDMAPMKPITYKSRDGLTINGFLTLPLGKPAKDLACVINPHGGPWARDSWGYNPEIQFLANRGYCVLQMNFRGSTGYGRQFWEASFKEWGGKMQDDVTDGVQWLISQGIADPKRIGIYGGSYGGYATLSGITKTPDLYAAAVSYVGVSNLFTFMQTIPPYWKTELEKLYAMVGDPEKDKALLRERSPALNADKIKTPLFIAQGAKDPRVNKAESDQVVEALKKRGVVVQYMVKDNEGHGFRNEENRYDFYGAMEKFLDKNLKPKAQD